METRRDIKKGEEITYDYASIFDQFARHVLQSHCSSNRAVQIVRSKVHL